MSSFCDCRHGGIGKTTLAQQIYNNSKINDEFLLHSWIWVSNSFTSRTDLLKEIIRNTGDSYGESATIAELQKVLCNALHGKSLFLVLDNVWDADVWTGLIKNAIERTTTKCRVLVTTRDRNPAIKMGAIHIHNVNKLSLEYGWELLCRKVFINNDERDIHRMKDVGMQIVEKCDGLPVAIKAIAGVLITKDQNKREWEDVLNSDSWTIIGLPEELRGALFLSYEALPSALKHCFLYCSLNPRDRKFYHDDLVCEWIAEGFIEAKGSASMEDVVKGYYMELIRRSFFQPDPYYADMYRCTMHDLLRALAQYLAGDESFSGDPEEAQSAGSMKKLRRLIVSSNRENVSIPHLDCLRRLWLWTPPSLDMQVIRNLKHLRLLFLNGDKIDYIPDCIGDLVHLRLLDLEHTSIRKLPDSLGSLINLQFLLLTDCKYLHNLPKSITKLCNLRRLNLRDTLLNYVPKGIGKLEHLNYMTGFFVGDSGGGDGGEGCDLEELLMLENLNHLEIDNLEKAAQCIAVLSNKPRLRELRLSCKPNTGGHILQEQDMDRIVQIFDELYPPASLEDLHFSNFFGGQYPKWMASASISTALREVIYLYLINCSNCPQLPQLGQLPRLKYLKIHGATAVVSIGSEFVGNIGELAASPAFPKLEYLFFMNMPNWEEWSLINIGEEDIEPQSDQKLLMLFPSLKTVSIFKCPKLKALPTGLNQANIQELEIISVHSLSCVSPLPSLRVLKVKDCPMLERVEKLDFLQSLDLITHQDNNTTTLPEWLISFFQ